MKAIEVPEPDSGAIESRVAELKMIADKHGGDPIQLAQDSAVSYAGIGVWRNVALDLLAAVHIRRNP